VRVRVSVSGGGRAKVVDVRRVELALCRGLDKHGLDMAGQQRLR
jgi:hypothetical protein